MDQSRAVHRGPEGDIERVVDHQGAAEQEAASLIVAWYSRALSDQTIVQRAQVILNAGKRAINIGTEADPLREVWRRLVFFSSRRERERRAARKTDNKH